MYRILKAILYASWMHRKQFRRGTYVPYVFHPLEVGWLLYRCGYETDLIVAGILHDTLEDTDADHNTIKRHFGRYVTFLVKCVSNNWFHHRVLAANGKTQFYVDAYNDAKIIKTCDVMANINSKLRKSGYVKPETSEKYRKFMVLREKELLIALKSGFFEYKKLFQMVRKTCRELEK